MRWQQALIILAFAGWSLHAAAHKYFFGIADLKLNSASGRLEIIHQYAYHDIEYILKSSMQQNEYNAEASFVKALQQYLTKHFSIVVAEKPITLNWVGYEIEFGQLIIYQESDVLSTFDDFSISNTIFLDHFPMQINTVNYQIEKHEGSLTFDEKNKKLPIPLL